MNKLIPVAASLFLTATLAACSPGINTPGQRITFDSAGMVVHARGEPNAHVSAKGDLSIGDKPVAVTPAQRKLLQQYYQQASGAMGSGVAMGKQGVAMAESGLHDAFASIFHHDSDAAEKKMDAQSQKIEASADALCVQIKTLGETQAAVASALPAFKPYAVSADKVRCSYTRTTTFRDDHGHSTTVTTTDGSEPTRPAMKAPATATDGAHASAAAPSQP